MWQATPKITCVMALTSSQRLSPILRGNGNTINGEFVREQLILGFNMMSPKF